MNALEVAQHVKVERGRLKRLWLSRAQTLQVPLGGREFGPRSFAFSGNQRSGNVVVEALANLDH
jgi:hypothetical protein